MSSRDNDIEVLEQTPKVERTEYLPFFSELLNRFDTNAFNLVDPKLFFDNALEIMTQKLFPQTVLEIKEDLYVSVEVLDNKRIWVNLSDHHVSRNILLHKEWEVNETFFLKNNLKKGQSFLDIGANIGWFSLLAAEIVGKQGSVIAFEPRPDLFNYFLKSIHDSNLYENIEAHNTALGDVRGYMTMSAIDRHNPGNSSFSTIHDESKQCWNVRVNLLDDILQDRPVDFIKIDVEGAEPLVFKGASKTLAKEEKPIIMSEIHPKQLKMVSGMQPIDYVNYLEGFGYECFLLEESKIHGRVTSEYSFVNEISSVVFFPASQMRSE